MSVQPNSLGSTRRVQPGKHRKAQVGGLADSHRQPWVQENRSFYTRCKGSEALARPAEAGGRRTEGSWHVLRGLGQHFPSIHLTPLPSCYWGVPMVNGYMDKYQCLIPRHLLLIPPWIYLASKRCVLGSHCSE